MRKVNLDAIKENVSTQYGDFTGVIQIDGFDGPMAINNLCKEYKFDISDKFIIGFGFGESTTDGIGKRDEVTCSILYVDKSEYGDGYDTIERKIKNDGTLKLKKKNIDIKYSSLGKYIKRYDFLAMTELTKHATIIEIENN